MEEKKPKSRYKAIKVDGVKYDEHRYLMEQYLGHELSSDLVVHHENENPRDNHIENLVVMTRAEHSRLHHLGRVYPPEVLARRPSRIGCTTDYNKERRKLTREQILFIRDNYVPGDKELGSRPLARRFGIDHKTIIQIVKNERYTDIV